MFFRKKKNRGTKRTKKRKRSKLKKKKRTRTSKEITDPRNPNKNPFLPPFAKEEDISSEH